MKDAYLNLVVRGDVEAELAEELEHRLLHDGALVAVQSALRHHNLPARCRVAQQTRQPHALACKPTSSRACVNMRACQPSTRAYQHTNTRAYQHACLSTCVHINTRAYQYACISTRVHSNMRAYQHACISTSVHINERGVHINTRAYQHACISTCVPINERRVHINTRAYQHACTSTNNACTSTCVLINRRAYQHACISTSAHINTRAYQHACTSTCVLINMRAYQRMPRACQHACLSTRVHINQQPRTSQHACISTSNARISTCVHKNFSCRPAWRLSPLTTRPWVIFFNTIQYNTIQCYSRRGLVLLPTSVHLHHRPSTRPGHPPTRLVLLLIVL
jgi:hypothetical protein